MHCTKLHTGNSKVLQILQTSATEALKHYIRHCIFFLEICCENYCTYTSCKWLLTILVQFLFLQVWVVVCEGFDEEELTWEFQLRRRIVADRLPENDHPDHDALTSHLSDLRSHIYADNTFQEPATTKVLHRIVIITEFYHSWNRNIVPNSPAYWGALKS